MDNEKLSFMIEVFDCHGCSNIDTDGAGKYICLKHLGRNKHQIYLDNRFKLTKSCPMIKNNLKD